MCPQSALVRPWSRSALVLVLCAEAPWRGGAGLCGAWLPAPEPLGGFASRVSAEGGETGAEPPGAAHPVPSHCCLDPEPAPVDIPPVEGGEETPDSQVGAHLAGQVRGNRGPKAGWGGSGGRSGFKVQSGCWKLAATVSFCR